MTTVASIRARDARWESWFVAEPPPSHGPIEPVEFVAVDRRALLAIVDEMRAMLIKHGHSNDCDMKLWRERAVKASCTCGLDSLLSRLGKEGA